MKIIFIRHGKPKIPFLKKLNALAFYKWVDSYNNSGICPTSKPNVDITNDVKKCSVIVCSELKRSVESAKILNHSKAILIDSVFNEVDLPVADWKTLKLSSKAWLIVFRVFWFFGYSKKVESFKSAKKRALIAAEKLEDISLNYGCVLLVGHGIFNRLIVKELKLSGWAGPKTPGTHYWSSNVYEK